MGAWRDVLMLALLCALVGTAFGQGAFVSVPVPEVDDDVLIEAGVAIEAVEASNSGFDMGGGVYAPMFPVVFNAFSANNVHTCRVRIVRIEPTPPSLELDDFDTDVFATDSTCSVRFQPYTLQDAHLVEVEFEIGYWSTPTTAVNRTTAHVGHGPFGGECFVEPTVVTEFSDAVSFYCTGFRSEYGEPLQAYVTSVSSLERTQSDSDDDDDDDDDDSNRASSPVSDTAAAYHTRSLNVNEFELVPPGPEEDLSTSHVLVDVRDNTGIGIEDDQHRFYVHLIDATSGIHRRELVHVTVNQLSTKERDDAIIDIYNDVLKPALDDPELFIAMDVPAKFRYTYQYYLVASSIRNRLFSDPDSVSKTQISIMKELADFNEQLVLAFMADLPVFGISPMILALEAVIVPFSEETRVSYPPAVYAGALRSVERLLANSTFGIVTNPYNQAALVRVSSAAVEALDAIKSSGSPTKTLLTPEVASYTRSLITTIEDTVYPTLVCGAPAFFEPNKYITLLNEVNTRASFISNPLVLPSSAGKSDTEFLMPAVAFAGTESNSAGCLLYDLSDTSDRLYPAASRGGGPCQLSVSTCTFREAVGTFNEQAIVTPSDDPILITFNVPANCESAGGNPCQFFLKDSEQWSSAGCKPVAQKRGKLQCACTHLTDFTALMDSTNGDGSSTGNGLSAQVDNVYFWLSLGFVLGAVIVVVVVAVVYDFFRIRKRKRIFASMKATASPKSRSRMPSVGSSL